MSLIINNETPAVPAEIRLSTGYLGKLQNIASQEELEAIDTGIRNMGRGHGDSTFMGTLIRFIDWLDSHDLSHLE